MSFTRDEARRTQAWLRDHPYAEDAGLADQLADQLGPDPFPGPDAPTLPPAPVRTEADAVAGLLTQDARHRAAGRSICEGVCSRWYDPADLDDLGTCGTRECLRVAVNP